MDRRYQMTRIRKGDYLLPSNDGARLFRIRSYMEDGSLQNDNGTPITGTFWEVEVWPGDYRAEWEMVLNTLDYDDEHYGERWESYWSAHRTRADAIRAALGT